MPWNARLERRLRAMIAEDIEADLHAGKGIVARPQFGKHKRVRLRRWRRRKSKPTRHVTRVLPEADTVPEHDPHRTARLDFYVATTARVEAY